MNAPQTRAALLVDDSRFDYLDMRNLLLGSQAGIDRLAWLQQWPGCEEALRSGPFDLFLVDMHLGSARGLDVIRELRSAGVRVPVIALTGQANDEIDRACAEAGASDFLVKGLFDRTMLERAIRYAEHQAATQQELDRLNAALERRALAENDQARLMRVAIEQATDGIFITHAATPFDQLAVVYVNAALCALVGRRAGELLGGDVSSLFVADPRTGTRMPDASMLPHAGASTTAALALNGSDAPVPVQVRITPIRSVDGVTEHLVWSCRVSDERQRHARLDRRRARYETIGQLAAGLAHDLNERVTALAGHLELLAARLQDDGQKRLLAGAVDVAERLGSQARLLMSFSQRTDATSDAVVDLPALLKTMERLLQHAVGGMIRLETTVEDDVGAARADTDGIELALIELALNARDAMPDGGTLRIDCVELPAGDPRRAIPSLSALDPDGDYIALSFTDSGTGMHAEVLAQAGREDFTTKAADRGTGAGLVLVEQAMQQAGGLLTLSSVAGEGTTATLFLPRVPADERTHRPGRPDLAA